MRRTARLVHIPILALALAGALAAPPAFAADALEHPLGHGKLLLKDSGPAARRIAFRARWAMAGDEKMNPLFDGSTLHIYGKGPTDGDSGLITLNHTRWHALGSPNAVKGYRYTDRTAAAGGIRTILVKLGKKSGSLKIVGGRGNWKYAIDGAQQEITVTFTIGENRWCAVFGGTFETNAKGRVLVKRSDAPQSCPCARGNSTFAAVQEVIFDRHGCTNSLCHGSAVQGGLDLRPDVSYKSLVDVASTKHPDMKLIEPGEQILSFLWLKVAAKTLPDQYTLASDDGAPMPNDETRGLSTDELEALRLWIRAGAPETGVVKGTENLLDACLPPPTPIKIRAPEPPAMGTGVQLHAPPWTIKPEGEGEVCYATYYDYSTDFDHVPQSVRTQCPDYLGGSHRECFYYSKTSLTQDPNSHHSIIHSYQGKWDPSVPGFDLYTCDGASDTSVRGKICPGPSGVPEPEVADCGTGNCVSTPFDITSKKGFGPFTCHGGATDTQKCNPFGIGVAAPAGADCGSDSTCAGRVTSTIACIGYGPPDFGFDVTGRGSNAAPSIGGSQQPFTKLAFPPGVFTVLPVQGFIVWNSHAFNLTDQAATNEQWLNLGFSGSDDREHQLQAVFDSTDIFVENVPPFQKHEYCRTYTFPKGARLFQFSSHTHKRGKLFRIFGPGIHDRCGTGQGIPAADCTPKPEDGPVIFTTLQYNDPEQLTFPSPVPFDMDDEDARTYKFCSLYDNGATNPDEVKRQSTSPPPPFNIPSLEGLIGGPCPNTTVACLSGSHKGELCGGTDGKPDNSKCDSVDQAGDGICDACPVHGGVTTEDEMYILLGFFYVAPGT